VQGPEFVSFAWSVLWVSLSLVELFLLFGSVSSGSEAILFPGPALIWGRICAGRETRFCAVSHFK
jgi:hypothetical protein